MDDRVTRRAITLRDATDDDILFAWKLYSDHCCPLITPFLEGHWDEVVEQQKFRAIWRPEMTKIVQFGASRIGWFSIRVAAAEVKLENFYIAMPYRGRGIGTTIVRDIIDTAAASGRLVQLHVLRGTAAVQFYQKLGFDKFSASKMTIEMKYQVSTKSAGGCGNVPRGSR